MKEIFPYIAPVLMVLWILSIVMEKWANRFGRYKTASLLMPAALFLALFPFNGISLAGYILSVNPVFSIGSTALLFVLIIGRLAGKDLLSQNDIVIFAVWNILLGLILYSSTLGLMGFDIYRFGYGSPPVFFIFVLLTITFFILKSPLGVIFVACVGAFDLGLLASGNLFDYITDGILFLFSCAILITIGIKKIIRPAMIDRTS